ncbi:hypothetical protein PG997_009079 [Apiospora hydei]|uniref:NACHT domain-containing protein n=1 Tax=Apiospora hydei TaxID=1337664 RepID=A0ABR1VT22_9PEZI
MAQPPDQPSAEFQAAKEGFLDTLSAAERSQFSALCNQASPEQLLDSIKPFSQRFKKERWAKVLSKIRGFTEALRPYVDVIGTVVSSHPEVAAIVWGAFRFVLQMAGNFSSFFEMLADMLNEIEPLIPRFGDLAMLLGDKGFVSPRLRSTLKDGTIRRTPVVIAELMWQPFTAKLENIKKRFVHHRDIVRDEVNILCLRQTVKNGEALAGYGRDVQSLLDTSELQAATADNTKLDVLDLCKKLKRIEERLVENQSIYSKMLQKDRDQSQAGAGPLRNEIMSFLQPPEFIQEYERAHSLRDPASGTWLFSSHQFSTWQILASETPMLWIKGKPGCGKSILASNIVDHLSGSASKGEEVRTVLYFFYNSREGLNSMDQMYRALLAQLIDSRVDSKAVVASADYALSRRQQGQVRGSPLTIRDLFFIILGRLPNVYTVIDAVDECEPDNRYEEHDQALRGELQILFDGIVTSGAKLLVLSRPSVWGLSNLSTDVPIQSLHMTSAMVSGDMERHCHDGLQNLCDNGYLPAMDSTLLQELCDTLLIGADGMFLWVRLMFSYLRSPVLAPPHLASAVRLRAIRSLRYPESLDQIYCRILGLIWAMPTYPRQLARQMFMWLLFSKKPYLDPPELHTFLSATFYFTSSDPTSLIPSNESHDILNEDSMAFSEAILVACSSLVELDSTGSHRYYRFIHSTTSEFFLTRLHSPDCVGIDHMQLSVKQYFQLCRSETEMELSSACLRYLLQFVPAKPLSGNILESASRDIVSQKYRFAAYASAYWTAHLRDAKVHQSCGHSSFEGNTSAFERVFRQFLDSQLNVNSWIELLYLLGGPETNARQHEILRRSVPTLVGQGGCPDSTTTFCDSLTRLSRDLETLEEKWGEDLQAAPHHIWNDTTAFVSSTFFRKTTATTVWHIGLDIPFDSSQSTKPLATVSTSDLAQSFLAKLTIWPSRLASIWSPEQAGQVPDLTMRIPHDYDYNYGFEFGGQGQYLLYWDNSPRDIYLPKEDFAKSLAVFELSLLDNANRPPIRLLRSWTCSFKESFASWTVHPTLPILAAHEVCYSKTSLWAFRNGTLEKGKAKEAQNEVAVTGKDLRHGTLICLGTGTLQSQQMQQYTGSDGKAVFQRHQITKNSLEVTQWSGGEVTTQSLVSLPVVDSLGHLNASFKIPETGTERLQVVLNKNQRLRYSILDEPDRHFPAVIAKDQRAIPKGKKRQIEGRDSEADESEVTKCRRVGWRHFILAPERASTHSRMPGDVVDGLEDTRVMILWVRVRVRIRVGGTAVAELCLPHDVEIHGENGDPAPAHEAAEAPGEEDESTERCRLMLAIVITIVSHCHTGIFLAGVGASQQRLRSHGEDEVSEGLSPRIDLHGVAA